MSFSFFFCTFVLRSGRVFHLRATPVQFSMQYLWNMEKVFSNVLISTRGFRFQISDFGQREKKERNAILISFNKFSLWDYYYKTYPREFIYRLIITLNIHVYVYEKSVHAQFTFSKDFNVLHTDTINNILVRYYLCTPGNKTNCYL